MTCVVNVYTSLYDILILTALNDRTLLKVMHFTETESKNI